MLDERLDYSGFQTFYTSKEQSRCPLIPEIVKIHKELLEKNLLENNSHAIISMRYGKRILINSSMQKNCLKIDDFLEIVDYDPVKNILVAIGPAVPLNETPLHFLIHNARREVNSIIQINNKKIIENLDNREKLVEEKDNYLEQAKEILTVLRDNEYVIIKSKGLIVTGKNILDSKEKLMSIS